MPRKQRLYLRRGPIADLPVLAPGEPGFTLDTHELFVGTAGGNQLLGQGISVYVAGNGPSAIDFANGSTQSLTLANNITALQNGRTGQRYVLYVTSNGSNYTWPATIKWASGDAPATRANGYQYIVELFCLSPSQYFGYSPTYLPQVLTQVQQSGCSNGQAVRFNGSAYVPAIADTQTNAAAAGIIQNVSGSTGDLFLFGPVHTTGMGALTPGVTYYLSQTVPGALTSAAPTTGVIAKMGYVHSSQVFNIDIDINTVVLNYGVLTPIDYSAKAASLNYWQLESGSGSVSYFAGDSQMGTGCFAFTGNGVWSVNRLYPCHAASGIGGYASFRNAAGSSTINIGYLAFDSNLNQIPFTSQQNMICSGQVTTNSWGYAQGAAKGEGLTANTLPINTRWIKPYLQIVSNQDTLYLDGFMLFPLTFSTLTYFG